MKALETLYFNDRKYRKVIHAQDIDDAALAHKIHHKRAKRLASKTKLSISIVATVCTAGLASPRRSARCTLLRRAVPEGQRARADVGGTRARGAAPAVGADEFQANRKKGGHGGRDDGLGYVRRRGRGSGEHRAVPP